MSSRATSIRPPYITIRSSRARAASYIPPPASPPVSTVLPNASAAEDVPNPPPRSFSPESDSAYTTMPRAILTSISSFFPTKSEHHMYSLPSSATSSLDSLSLPVPASPQQATFGTEVWQEHGHFRTGGRPTAREARPWWSSGVSVRPSSDY